MPPGYTEDSDAWLNELTFPQFSVQSPKGNEIDPLATVPVAQTFQFSDLVQTRLRLTTSILEIPGVLCYETNQDFTDPALYTYAVDFATGTTEEKLVWNGVGFTNSVVPGRTVYGRRVITMTWNQETNHLAEVYWSPDMTNWFSLQDVQYTGQWTFIAADMISEQRRFYRLVVQTP